MSNKESVLYGLMRVIVDRKANPPPKSYTTELLAGGNKRLAAKLTEETAEIVAELSEFNPTRTQALVHESCDLIYHLWVALAANNVSLNDVESELERRFGKSGLDEKASRGQTK